MDTPTPERFIDALRRLEAERDPEPIVALFADDAELSTPAAAPSRHGTDGARRFWTAYRHSFDEVGSTFRHVVAGEGAALLEWSSRGRLADGTPFAYDGVSVIEYDGPAIRRFRAYYDPFALRATTPPA